MPNNDPTGFKRFFPWIHPTEWTYPAPNQSHGSLDALQTTIDIISNETHTLIRIERPNLDTHLYGDPTFIIFETKVPTNADNPDIYGIAAQSAYFQANENEDPEKCHFSIWVTLNEMTVLDTHSQRIILKKGTPLCLNPNRTSLGVSRGLAKLRDIYNPRSLASYPHSWIYPHDPKTFLFTKDRGTLGRLPPEFKYPDTINTIPDFFA